MIPVLAEDPTGRTVEVNDPLAEPTSSDPVVAFMQGMRDGLAAVTRAEPDPVPFTVNASNEEWQAFYFLCAAHARVMASAEEIAALSADLNPGQSPEDRIATANANRENAATYRDIAARYQRMAEDRKDS